MKSTTTPHSTSPTTSHTAKAWWRYPYVWMVIGGPLSVVLACAATAVVIMNHPETLVAQDYYQQGININKTLDQQSSSLAPALAARNHAQTGQVPAKLLPK